MIIFLDCDNTICASKQKISPEMKNVLSNLSKPLLVISGASRSQIEWQLDGLPAVILAQSGNDTPLWQNHLLKHEQFEIFNHVKKFGNPLDLGKYEDRGSQVAYSLIGHDKPQELKNSFDPDQKIRQAVLKEFPFKSKTLTCKIAGTTCLDYTKKYGTKGHNIKRWIWYNKLNNNDCVFYGDALFKGGNDESVKGIIRCVAVIGPADLLCKLKNISK